MKKLFIFFVFLFLQNVKTFALDASVSAAVFNTGGKPYVEIQFNFSAKTMRYKMLQDTLHWQTSAEIVLIFKQNEKIMQFDKYLLNGPVTASPKDFFDLKRYAIAEGDYTLEISITDALDLKNVKKITLPIHVFFDKEKLEQSDIQLVKTFTRDTSNSPLAKNGYLMQTLPFDFCDKNTERITIYNELYNSNKTLKEDFSATFLVYDAQKGQNSLPILTQNKKLSPSATNIIFTPIDVTKLASGNYLLVVEIRNKNKELLSQKTTHFQRSNPYLNLLQEGIADDVLKDEFVEKLSLDSLDFSLRAIFCQLVGDETTMMNQVIKGKDPKAMRFHLFRYWSKRSPNNPEKAYLAYMKIAKAVDKTYRSGFGYGFENDRGYVYLKYGAPNDVTSQSTSPDASAYEVWSYNDFPVTKQSNVKFLFWDADGSGNMRILHSNARGEISDKNWKTKLYRNARNQWTNDGFDPTDVQDNVGRNADRLLEDF
jgi:GWxTD domain-containing protein